MPKPERTARHQPELAELLEEISKQALRMRSELLKTGQLDFDDLDQLDSMVDDLLNVDEGDEDDDEDDEDDEN